MKHPKQSRRKFAMRTFTLVKNPAAAHPQPVNDDNSIYCQLFNLTNVVKLIIDPDTLQIVEANPAACAFYGYSQAQIKSLSITDINSLPEDQIRVNVQSVVTGTKTIYETRHRIASGEIRDVEVQAGLLALDRKKFFYAIVQDITERKRMENAVRKSERLYRLLAQNMPDTSVIMFDTEMRYTLVEGPFLKRFGTVADTMLGRLPHETDLAPDALAFIIPIYQRALNGESFSYERQTADYAYESHVAPLRNENGQIIGGITLSHDITELKRAESALLNSEQRLQLIISTMGEGVITLQKDGVIDSCNPAAARILGLTPAQMMGRASIDPRWWAVHEDGSPFPGETYPAMITLRTGQPQNNVIMGVHKLDDTRVWISINTRAMIRPHESQPYGVVATLIDITEQKRLNDILTASEERLRSTFDYASIGMALVGLDGRWLDVNPAICHIVGYSSEELLQKTFQDVTHPDDLELDLQNVQHLLAGKIDSYRMEKRYFHKQGHVIWALLSVSLVRDQAGVPLYFISQIQDITERKRLENELRASEEQLRLITDNTQDLITQSNSQNRIVYASPSSRLLLGYEPEDMTGHFSQEFISPEDLDILVSVQQQMIHQGLKHGTSEGRLRHADGRDVDVEMAGRLLYDGDGNYVGGICVTRDISERKRLERELRRNEEELRLITDNIQDMITRSDAQDRITYASPSCRLLLGYEPEEMTGHFRHEFIPPDVWDSLVSSPQQLIQEWISRGVIESPLRHADGHMVNVETTGRFLYDGDGNYSGSIFVSRDITERKRFETALRESEERLRFITDNMLDMIMQVDAQDCIHYVSPSSRSLLGYKPEEMIGHFGREFVLPDDFEKIVASRQQLIRQGFWQGVTEFRLRHADGHDVPVETTGRFLYDRDGNDTGSIFVSRDITERKQFEAALRESEEKYRLIAENTSDGIFVFDHVAKRTVYVSPTYERLLGCEPGEALSLPMTAFLDILHPEDRDGMLRQFDEAIARKANDLTQTYRSRRKEGGYFWREDHTRFNYAADGEILSTYVVSRDITERKQMEDLLLEKQKLQTSIEKEYELSQLKTRMMERIAHEFRTPLSVIQSVSESLIHYHDRLMPEKREEKGEVIKDQIRRITSMLDEIAQVLRSTDSNHLSQQMTDLCVLCRRIALGLSASLKLPDKYQLELPEHLNALIDRRIFEDSLTHIMLNAARYSAPADPVTVRLAQTADCIELRVIDHGIGIRPDELSRIFEPFFRGSNINERGGLGVGLTIARAAIEAHGGTIRVESEMGKGTTVIVTLPV